MHQSQQNVISAFCVKKEKYEICNVSAGRKHIKIHVKYTSFFEVEIELTFITKILTPVTELSHLQFN